MFHLAIRHMDAMTPNETSDREPLRRIRSEWNRGTGYFSVSKPLFFKVVHLKESGIPRVAWNG
jgi:hypothetical protein